MVYMAADNSGNEDSLADLTTEAASDLDEMMSVGSNDDLDVIVQIDWKPGTQIDGKPKIAERCRIRKGGTETLQVATGPVNSGSPTELSAFLEFARTTPRADNYMLILWGHAVRFAFGFDHNDSLTVPEMAAALRSSAQAGSSAQADKPDLLDVLGFDACGTSTIETAYQLRKSAHFVVASEIGVPLPGWPYTRILRAIEDDPSISAEDLGREVVSRYVASYPRDDVSLTMLDLRSPDNLVPQMKELATSLAIAVGQDRDQRDTILSLFRDARVPTGEPLVDLGQLCVNLRQNGIGKRVESAASDMLARLAKGAGVVVEHQGDGGDTAGLCGVSAYAPHVGRPEDSWLAIYDQLALSKETIWPKLVKFLAYADSY